jgi:uncharacterized protein (DUF736 family)
METRINTGAIFKNDNKKAENHPDYKGKVNVNGKEMEVALWLKTSAKGVKFMSASFSEPFVKSEPQIKNNEPQNTKINGTLKQAIIHESNFDNDDLPF